MASASDQAHLLNSYNNFGLDFITPYTASQDIVVASVAAGTSPVCKFDVTNQAILCDQIDEMTAAAGIIIDSVLVKDGGLTLAGDLLADGAGTRNIGDATNYIGNFFVERIYFKGTQGNSAKDPTTDAPADWGQVDLGGVAYYIPLYAVS